MRSSKSLPRFFLDNHYCRAAAMFERKSYKLLAIAGRLSKYDDEEETDVVYILHKTITSKFSIVLYNQRRLAWCKASLHEAGHEFDTKPTAPVSGPDH